MNQAGIRQEAWFGEEPAHPAVAAYLIGRLCNAVDWLLLENALTFDDRFVREAEHLLGRIVNLAAILELQAASSTPTLVTSIASASQELMQDLREWWSSDKCQSWYGSMSEDSEFRYRNWGFTQGIRKTVIDQSHDLVQTSLEFGRLVDQSVRPIPQETAWNREEFRRQLGTMERPVLGPAGQPDDDFADTTTAPAINPVQTPDLSALQIVAEATLPAVVKVDGPWDPVWLEEVRVLGSLLNIHIADLTTDTHSAALATCIIDVQIRESLGHIPLPNRSTDRESAAYPAQPPFAASPQHVTSQSGLRSESPDNSSSLPPVLTSEEVMILKALRDAQATVKQENLGVKVDLSVRTIGPCLTRLRNAGFIHKPNGKRKGDAITQAGLAALKSIESP